MKIILCSFAFLISIQCGIAGNFNSSGIVDKESQQQQSNTPHQNNRKCAHNYL